MKLPPGIDANFQTPPIVANYMATMIPRDAFNILEPTPGIGNLVVGIKLEMDYREGKYSIVAPTYFEDIKKDSRFDCIVMNPPFTPMKEGYRYLTECMEMSDNVIALLPWFILINSERRMKTIREFGLISVTHLPRKTFPGCRIQCCVLEMKKGYTGLTSLKHFTW